METKLALLTAPLRRVIDYYNDPDYFSQIRKIALPITLQNFVFSALNMASVIMIGQKGDVAVAAVGLAGQIFFLLNLVLFGLGSGTGIFAAQLWGKRDIKNIRKVLALSLRLSFGAAMLFFIFSQFFSTSVLEIYSTDERVVAVGAEYLRIFSWSFFFFAITFGYVFILRSTGNVRLPVAASVISLLINAILTYALVFGKYGLPAYSVNGAAIAIIIARGIECAILLIGIYLQKDSVAAVTLSELLYFDWSFTWKIMRPVIPVAINEIFWSFGITTYNIIYARMGTESIAAINIFSTIDNMAFIFFIGLGNATAILVGNKIGSHELVQAQKYAGRSIGLAISFGLVVGFFVLLLRGPILSIYNVSPKVAENAYQIMTIAAFVIWMRASNMVIITGILRSGGDTMYSLVLDGLVIWLIGVPLAALGAFYFMLPIQWVYFLILSEEITKFFFGLRRYLSRKWINNLTHVI
ncbi:MAG: MATE family efflux transporter [Chloroflexi bacterium]|nr:MATE family efflux transporter [Chloroflexota bacterium]